MHVTWKRAAVAAALAAACLATAATAAADPTTVTVRGTQVPVDPDAGTYTMTGSLVGRWRITAFTVRYADATQFVGTGRERFVGCLDSNRNGTCNRSEPAG